MKFNWFENASPGAKIVLTFTLMVVVMTIFSFLSVLIAMPVFHKGMMEIMSAASNVSNPENLAILKYLQLVQSIAIFVVPPFLLAYLFGSNPKDYLLLRKKPSSNIFLLTALILIAFLPFINYTETLNSHLRLPEALKGMEQWMKSAEDKATALSNAFLNVKTIWALLFNIVMMAIIPAIGEELVFRGVLQRLFTELTRNYHWGVIIAATVFSAIHLQFYGFVPRLLLGVLFGYLFIWSGSIWVTIFAHFLNNAMGVIYYYMTFNGQMDNRLEPFGTNVTIVTAFISLVITFGLLYVFKKRSEIDA